MAFKRSAQRQVVVKRGRRGGGGYAFAAEGADVSADVQPMSGEMAQRMYGLEPEQMRRLLAAAGADIRPGDGVCVGVEAGAAPDYRVTYVAKWMRHTEAHLRWIPPAQRGADG